MSTREAELAVEYETARPHLLRVAYAVLGSRTEAEDVVAECWLRLPPADEAGPVRDVVGWATVVVARAAVDVLRSARRRREVYPGECLPEPLVAPADERITLDERISYALMVALERLTPAERVAWVLHDLFAMPFDDIARTVGRSPGAVRQLAKRARDRVQATAPRVPVDRDEHAAVVRTFMSAAVGGNLLNLVAVLDPNVVLTSDGGGVVSSARRPVTGADRVARFVLGIVSRIDPGEEVDVMLVNGDPGIVVRRAGVFSSVLSFTISGAQISRIDIVRAPAKLPR